MIRVLVVDDSAVLRQQICYILQSDPELHVVGQAKDGNEALRLTKDLRPDVITMDIRMPHMDGFEAIRHIMAESPVPIVVVTGSDVDRQMEVARKAIRLGAVSVLIKPGAMTSPTYKDQATRLIEQVKLMSGVRVITRIHSTERVVAAPHSPPIAPRSPSVAASGAADTRLIAIGASTGGPAALYKVLSGLPADLPVPVVIVQHISFGFVGGLAEWLNGGCDLEIEVPEHGQRIEAGHVYIAPDEHHMRVDRFGRIRLYNEAPVGGHRPSVTVLFESVAQEYGASAIAAILTGMGADGAVGMESLKRAGARTIAQDEQSCVVFGMPKEAIARGAIDHVVPLDKIATTIMALCVRQQASVFPGSVNKKGEQ